MIGLGARSSWARPDRERTDRDAFLFCFVSFRFVPFRFVSFRFFFSRPTVDPPQGIRQNLRAVRIHLGPQPEAVPAERHPPDFAAFPDVDPARLHLRASADRVSRGSPWSSLVYVKYRYGI